MTGGRSGVGSWDAVWGSRAVAEGAHSVLQGLIDADGFDSSHGGVGEPAWRTYVERWRRVLRLAGGDSVVDVGCGAGAFLYPLAEAGVRVGGLDRSSAQLALASRAIPDGEFVVGDALDLAPEPAADVVLSMSTFIYFPSLDYAARVVSAMVSRATRAVAVLDVADAARRGEDLRRRIRAAGGEAAYARRYAGLEHLYYDRAWMTALLEESGLTDVRCETQSMEGYGNAPFRFNCWGFVP